MGRTFARFTLIAAGILTAVVPSLNAQATPSASPVTALLRLSGEQRSFKLGEPIRIELVLTANTAGFVVDTAGTEHATDTLTVSPAEGFHRLQPIQGRDYLHIQNLLPTPTVLEFAVNHWLRFDQAGTYTVSLQTNRVWTSGPGGSLDRQTLLPVTMNAVTFRIETTSDEDEQALVSAASQRLQSAVLMGAGDKALAAQIRAAEDLAFLPGDLAAVEKYRWYRQLTTVQGIASNALHAVRRGFATTRNQGLILAEIEAELTDLSRPVSADTIGNAAMLATMIKYPAYQTSHVVTPVDRADPFVIERARYLELVHASLDRRVGLVKLQSAGAMLDVLSTQTPPDVVQMLVEGFEQLPASTRSWFASGRWETIRNTRLGPALRRTLDEVEPGSRSYIYPALIDIAPDLAVAPLTRDILDPTRIISADVVRKMPASSLSHIAPDLLALINTMSNRKGNSRPDQFRIDQKVRLLEVVADESVRAEVRAVYDAWPPSGNNDVRTGLLRYLLRFDPEEGTRRARQAIQDGANLYALASHGPIPAVSTLLQERLFDRDVTRAAEAAALLASYGRAEDRDGLDVRLLQWRLDRQQRFSNGEALTEADGVFEAALVRALAHGRSWRMSVSDQDRLVANCLTAACKVALRPRE